MSRRSARVDGAPPRGLPRQAGRLSNVGRRPGEPPLRRRRHSMGVNLEIGATALRSDGLYSVQLTCACRSAGSPRPARGAARRTRDGVRRGDGRGGRNLRGRQRAGGDSDTARPGRRDAKKYYAYSLTLVMRKGEQRVAVGVRDDLAEPRLFSPSRCGGELGRDSHQPSAAAPHMPMSAALRLVGLLDVL